MIALAFLAPAALAAAPAAPPFSVNGPDARLDCVLGPRGTRDRDRVLTIVIGGYVAHATAPRGWSGPADPLRIGGGKDLFKGAGGATITYHPAGGVDLAARLADGRSAKVAMGAVSIGPGTVPLALDVSGGAAYPPLSGGCTLSTGDFATLADGVGS